MDTLQYAVYGIGAIGVMPLALTTIGALIERHRRRKAARIMRRFADRMGL